MALKAKRKTVLIPREIEIPPSGYQPTNAELEEEFDMSGADMETVRRAFFRPTKIVRRKAKK